MSRIGAHELRQHRLELETEIGEPLPENPIRGLGFLVGLRPRVDERAHSLVAVEIADRYFELVGGRSPPDA